MDSTIRPQTRLGLMVLVALAVHGAILFGVRYQQSPPEASRTQPLKIALVQAPNRLRPDEKALEAEADHRSEENFPPSVPELAVPTEQPVPEIVPIPAPAVTPPEPVPVVDPAPPPVAAEPEPVQEVPEPAAADPEPQVAAPVQPKPKIRAQSKPTLRAKDLIRQARQLAQLSTPEQTVDRDKTEQQPSTRYSVREAYIRAWVRKVQDWGTRNFPEEARRDGLTGSLTLRVTLRHDGALSEILLIRSSGHPVLDQAARNIVELAAPYAPFPTGLRETEGDYLSIRRTWRFLRGSQLKSE